MKTWCCLTSKARNHGIHESTFSTQNTSLKSSRMPWGTTQSHKERPAWRNPGETDWQPQLSSWSADCTTLPGVQVMASLSVSKIIPRKEEEPIGQMKSEESEVTQSCPILCDPMDCRLPGFSIHGIFQARILEWVAISFSRGSSQPRNKTWVSWIAGRCLTLWATRQAQGQMNGSLKKKSFLFWTPTFWSGLLQSDK